MCIKPSVDDYLDIIGPSFFDSKGQYAFAEYIRPDGTFYKTRIDGAEKINTLLEELNARWEWDEG